METLRLSSKDLLARPEGPIPPGQWQPVHFVPPTPIGTGWHYTDANGFMGIVSSHQVWAAASLALNDTSEVTYGTGLIYQLWRDAEKDELPSESIEFAEDVLGFDFENFAADGMFVLSASLEGDLLSQWRNYAGTDGFAVGLNLGVPLSIVAATDSSARGKALSDFGVVAPLPYAPIVTPQWAEVTYDLPSQREIATRVLRDLIQAVLREGFDGGESSLRRLRMDVASLVLRAAALMKHPAFMDEREVRFLCTKSFAGDVEDYRVRGGRLVPFVRAAANLDQDAEWRGDGSEPLPISAVRYGPSSDLRGVAVAAQLLERRGYSDVKVDRSSIPIAG